MRDWTSLDEMSPWLVAAVLGAEDPVFFQHKGFWWKQIKRAVWRGVLQRERIRQVSTITQQLARNLYLSPERSMLRKAREAMIAWRIETALTKRRILEIYLNVVEWGDGVWGIGAASREVCGCAPSDLDAFQGIVLASLLPAPRTPLIGENAKRAFAVQRRLPLFLYATGLLSRSGERDVHARAARLADAVLAGTDLPVAMQMLSGGQRDAPGSERPHPSMESLIADEFRWSDRLRFESFVYAATPNRESFDRRPLWWTENEQCG